MEDIFRQLKLNNSESMYDEDDVILKGFPLDSLNRLNEINMTLKSHKSFSKKLVNILELTLFYNFKFDYFYWQFCFQVKKLRQFHGPSVSLVTKSIMDVLFTNRLGCKISLTGRGA